MSVLSESIRQAMRRGAIPSSPYLDLQLQLNDAIGCFLDAIETIVTRLDQIEARLAKLEGKG